MKEISDFWLSNGEYDYEACTQYTKEMRRKGEHPFATVEEPQATRAAMYVRDVRLGQVISGHEPIGCMEFTLDAEKPARSIEGYQLMVNSELKVMQERMKKNTKDDTTV